MLCCMPPIRPWHAVFHPSPFPQSVGVAADEGKKSTKTRSRRSTTLSRRTQRVSVTSLGTEVAGDDSKPSASAVPSQEDTVAAAVQFKAFATQAHARALLACQAIAAKLPRVERDSRMRFVAPSMIG